MSAALLPPIDGDLVADLRHKLLQRIENQGTENFHPMDIERIRQSDFYLWRFLVHQRKEISWAVDMAIDCLKWRKDFGTNDIKESDFPKFLEDIGAIYVFNKDREGNRIIMIHVKRYRKEPAIAKLTRQYFVHFLEKFDKDEPNHTVSVLFDMQGAGLQNVDMDYLSFMFSCFKTYYPATVAYIYAFEMPWLFSAIWKVVKGWMSVHAVEKVKFVNKNTIVEYVDPDELPMALGGNITYSRPTCDYPADFSNITTMNETNQGFQTPDVSKKKVHFATNGTADDASPLEELRPVENNDGFHRVVEVSNNSKRFLRISPSEELVFQNLDSESPVTLILTSNTKNMVAFKVKTTAPTKYRVRPSVGIIQPGSTAEVMISLWQGSQDNLEGDKFLVIGMELEGEPVSLADLGALWHTVPREQLLEHKIRCISLSAKHSAAAPPAASGSVRNADATFSKIEVLAQQNRNLQREVKKLRYVIYIVLLFQLLFFVVLGSSTFNYGPWSTSKHSEVDSCPLSPSS